MCGVDAHGKRANHSRKGSFVAWSGVEVGLGCKHSNRSGNTAVCHCLPRGSTSSAHRSLPPPHYHPHPCAVYYCVYTPEPHALITGIASRIYHRQPMLHACQPCPVHGLPNSRCATAPHVSHANPHHTCSCTTDRLVNEKLMMSCRKPSACMAVATHTSRVEPIAVYHGKRPVGQQRGCGAQLVFAAG